MEAREALQALIIEEAGEGQFSDNDVERIIERFLQTHGTFSFMGPINTWSKSLMREMLRPFIAEVWNGGYRRMRQQHRPIARKIFTGNFTDEQSA